MLTRLYRIHYDDHNHNCNGDLICTAADAKDAMLIFLFNNPGCSPSRIEHIGEDEYRKVLRAIEQEEKRGSVE